MKTPNTRSRRRGALVCVCAAALVVAERMHAGPLTPPVGPVASTGKTTQEIFDKVAAAEPRTAINTTNTPGTGTAIFRITQPGSYYLTGNITGVAGKNGIEIASSGVTVDLNGFDLAGIAGSLDGVTQTAINLEHITVLNGSVRNWGSDGVSLSNAGIANCRVEHVLTSGNGGFGIFVASDCIVANCSANKNGNNGISTGAGCRVWNCVGTNNSGSGITIGIGSTISGCVARLNTLDGIRCVSGCLIVSNACDSNGLGAGDGAGIHATGGDNRIEGNNCTAADRGLDVDTAGNFIVKNTCSGNAVNWVIVANNVCGPIIDRSAPASAAINSSSAPSSLGTTDPNANFTY